MRGGERGKGGSQSLEKAIGAPHTAVMRFVVGGGRVYSRIVISGMGYFFKIRYGRFATLKRINGVFYVSDIP